MIGNASHIWSDCGLKKDRVEYYKVVRGHYFVLIPDSTTKVVNEDNDILWENECTKSVDFVPGGCTIKYKIIHICIFTRIVGA